MWYVNKLKKLLLVSLASVTLAQEAYAYFDPGTGSILIQLLIAVLGGIAVFFGAISSKVKKILQKLRSYLGKVSERKSRRASGKYYLLATCIGIYAAVFYDSHNIYEFTLLAVAVDILLFSVSSLLLILVCNAALTKVKNREQILHGLLFLLFVYYMRLAIVDKVQTFYIDVWDSPPPMLVKAGFVVLLGAFFFTAGWMLARNVTKVTIVVVLMSLLPAFNIISAAYLRVAVRAVENKITRKLSLYDTELVFQHKPNVYMLAFDGYTNKEGMAAVGLTMSPKLLSYLNRERFTVYPAFYSNVQPTRNAMPTFFNMDTHLDNQHYHNVHVDTKRGLIAGNSHVFQLFKHNGYNTKTIMDTANWVYMQHHLHGGFCFVDQCLSTKDDIPPVVYLQTFDRVIVNGLLTTKHHQPTAPNVQQDADDRCVESLRAVASRWQRQFVYAHFRHPNHAKHDTMCDEQVEAEKYAHRLDRTNQLMMRLITVISAADPDAMIIITSDHGPYILNRCAKFAPLLSREEVVERQGILLAIRWGKNYDGRYDKEIKSSANLFRYIFSYLTGHEKLLLNKPADDAFSWDGAITKTIDDGVILLPNAAALQD